MNPNPRTPPAGISTPSPPVQLPEFKNEQRTFLSGLFEKEVDGRMSKMVSTLGQRFAEEFNARVKARFDEMNKVFDNQVNAKVDAHAAGCSSHPMSVSQSQGSRHLGSGSKRRHERS